MPHPRNLFTHGLRITLRRLPALLWIYAFNLGLAIVFSLRLHSQLSDLTSHSLAAQRLSTGFDLSTIAETLIHLGQPPSSIAINTAGIPLYFLIYFLLVPGTLFCYLTATPARLGTLLQQGLSHFWRFVRITLVTLIVSAIILGPLIALQNVSTNLIDKTITGRPAFLYGFACYILIGLVAAVLRLYFDLVEVYTVQLGHLHFHKGKPDRRIRRTLLPALRTLRHNFTRAYLTFITLTLLGLAAVALTAHTAMHQLAQPRVWSMFLLAQLGLFLMLLTRFWQRGAATTLILDFPIPIPHPRATPPINSPSHSRLTDDPIPGPEPASPSLDEPDPGVFHHTPHTPAPVGLQICPRFQTTLATQFTIM
jgi:hypothetical protein